MGEPLRVIISLDVEEEGLFSGQYSRFNPPVSNVAHLRRLKPLSQELNLPLTLLCSYSVLNNNKACDVLDDMRSSAGAEIGLHLHHWNTPPIVDGSNNGPPERTDKIHEAILRQKLINLVEAGKNFLGETPVSFRMGRWDLKAKLLPLLADLGIKVDSSICPLRSFAGGADHFLAPVNPYWYENDKGKVILEAPITQVPLFPGLAKSWHYLWSNSPGGILDSFHFFGAMSANPLWHSSFVMRQAVRTHIRRGGRLLNIFLHSSELMPGASPHVPDQAAADRLIEKITSFCRWLFKNYECEGIVMNKLPDLAEDSAFPLIKAEEGRDW